MRFRLNCGERDEMFAGNSKDLIWKLRRMRLIPEKSIHNIYVDDSMYKETYMYKSLKNTFKNNKDRIKIKNQKERERD